MTNAAKKISSGRRVGRYLVCGEIASGGMASVHLGRLLGPVGFSKIVAIKRLHAEFATDPEFLVMFIDEARLASAINHPNVVASLDVVAEQDELLLVMEYVQGETLAQLHRVSRQRKAPASLGVIQRILCDALDGLHAAHTASIAGRALNIVHRDVSPQNIIVGANGVASVLDFGIAKAESQRQLTRPGRVKGKPAYLSPEQLSGQLVDARTDVFSAGVVLWESLTGERLFASKTMDVTAERVLSAPIPLPSSRNSAVSAALDRVVMKSLNRERTLRYDSAAQFADALRAVAGEATRADVSAWVHRTAAEVLAQRTQALEELEAMDSLHTGFFQLQAAPESNLEPVSAQPHPAPRLARETTGAAHVSRESASLSVLDKRRPWQPLAAWGLGLGLLGTAVTWWVTSSAPHPLRTTRAAPSPTSIAPSPTSIAPATKVMTDSSRGLAAVDAGTPVPIVQLEQLGRTPRDVAASSSAERVAPAKRAGASRVARPARNCDPPYKIDASGVRRVRFECL